MGKQNSTDRNHFGFGNTELRFTQSDERVRSNIAKDRFAFDQTLQGYDCQKIRDGEDFVVQRCDFFGNKVGGSHSFEVKTVDSQLSEALKKGSGK